MLKKLRICKILIILNNWREKKKWRKLQRNGSGIIRIKQIWKSRFRTPKLKTLHHQKPKFQISNKSKSLEKNKKPLLQSWKNKVDLQHLISFQELARIKSKKAKKPLKKSKKNNSLWKYQRSSKNNRSILSPRPNQRKKMNAIKECVTIVAPSDTHCWNASTLSKITSDAAIAAN